MGICEMGVGEMGVGETGTPQINIGYLSRLFLSFSEVNSEYSVFIAVFLPS